MREVTDDAVVAVAVEVAAILGLGTGLGGCMTAVAEACVGCVCD